MEKGFQQELLSATVRGRTTTAIGAVKPSPIDITKTTIDELRLLKLPRLRTRIAKSTVINRSNFKTL